MKYTILDEQGFPLFIRYFEEKPPLSTEKFDVGNFIKARFDFELNEFVEGATKEEIELANKSLVPETISMMSARMQLVLMGTSMENIIQVIKDLPKEQLSDIEKKLILIKLEYATHLDRYSPELVSLGKLIFTDEQLDYLFINASKL